MRKKLTNIDKLWHLNVDLNVEEPEEHRQILINAGGYCYVVFYHKKDRRFYDRLRPHFFLQEINKWMYIDEIL